MNGTKAFARVLNVVGGILVAIALLIMLASFLLGLTTRLILVGFEWWVWLILILGIILLLVGTILGRSRQATERDTVCYPPDRYDHPRERYAPVDREEVIVEQEVVTKDDPDTEVVDDRVRKERTERSSESYRDSPS